MVVDVMEKIVADGVGIPDGPAEEVLHPIGGGIAGQFGELPAILPLGVAEQTAEVVESPPSRLRAREERPQPLTHGLHLLGPAAYVCLCRSS